MLKLPGFDFVKREDLWLRELRDNYESEVQYGIVNCEKVSY